MKKLAIVGTHTRTRSDAPWDDPNYEIWTFNEAPQKPWCKRWDVLFQLHKREVYQSPYNFAQKDHWDWLQKEHGKTIFMQAVDPLIPDSVEYPIEAIQIAVPGASLSWFRSSFAYAIAYAIYKGYKEVDIYGADMASNTEYGYQLPNFQFWIGIALGTGIRFGVLSNEKYFTAPLYGYEGEIQIPREHFEKRAIELADLEQHTAWEQKKAYDRLNDALLAGNASKVNDLIAKLQDAAVEHGKAGGAMDEAKRYAGRDDLIPRQEFERTAAQAQIDGEEKRRDMWIAAGESQYVWNVWNQTANRNALEQLRKFITKQTELAYEHGVRTGVYRENADYMNKVDDLITAAGGAHTLAALGVA